MRFSLQDLKKTIQRRDGELYVSLHFLRDGALQTELEKLIAYHERLLGQPQRQFAVDEARSYIGDYRLANCLLATLSRWYTWQQRDWATAVQRMRGSAELQALSSPVSLRLALYQYVNLHYQGFLDESRRGEALQDFAHQYALNTADLEYLLAIDSDEEGILVRQTEQAPTPQEVTALYNQWAFEAALFNASNVSFVVDCQAFARVRDALPEAGIGSGVGAVIKRLCYLARRLGVYYDLSYASGSANQTLLTLTLYGPQEVTGAPQQYGLRLARLCRLLLGYGVASRGKATRRPTLSAALIEARARVHFLQKSYLFALDDALLHLLPPLSENSPGQVQSDSEQLFDSSIEQAFSEAFQGAASSQGVDGWKLEREPEPLLLPKSIFIPDFAFTRDQQRVYVEILGFWTPAYRERKVQKLQQLRTRTDLVLAIPREAREAFAGIAQDFPIVYYHDQLSITDMLQLLRSRYDDFASRLARIEPAAVLVQVRRAGIVPEQACYPLLHCYRHAELQRAAELVVEGTDDCAFVAGLGLYQRGWSERVRHAFHEWLRARGEATLSDVASELAQRWPVLQESGVATVETLLGLWPEIRIRRSSIFDVIVEFISTENTVVPSPSTEEPPPAASAARKTGRRATSKKRPTGEPEAIQGGLWG